jgi:hypothetical protein
MIELLFFLAGAFVGWAYTSDRKDRQHHLHQMRLLRRLTSRDINSEPSGRRMATPLK